ncbi:uncharacterized protein LOC144103708 [Amblyomma americanum]
MCCPESLPSLQELYPWCGSLYLGTERTTAVKQEMKLCGRSLPSRKHGLSVGELPDSCLWTMAGKLIGCTRIYSESSFAERKRSGECALKPRTSESTATPLKAWSSESCPAWRHRSPACSGPNCATRWSRSSKPSTRWAARRTSSRGQGSSAKCRSRFSKTRMSLTSWIMCSPSTPYHCSSTRPAGCWHRSNTTRTTASTPASSRPAWGGTRRPRGPGCGTWSPGIRREVTGAARHTCAARQRDAVRPSHAHLGGATCDDLSVRRCYLGIQCGRRSPKMDPECACAVVLEHVAAHAVRAGGGGLNEEPRPRASSQRAPGGKYEHAVPRRPGSTAERKSEGQLWWSSSADAANEESAADHRAAWSSMGKYGPSLDQLGTGR